MGVSCTKDKPEWNPVSIYKGNMQYKVAFSTGDIKGTNIRIFGDHHKYQCEVPKEMFTYVATNLGVKDKIEGWESRAVEYKAPTQHSSSDNTSSDDVAF